MIREDHPYRPIFRGSYNQIEQQNANSGSL
jgi:hypothetical protein